MESPMKEYRTHGIIVKKHKDWKEIGIAITPQGSVIIFRDIDNMLYAVYSNTKGKYHIHIPYKEIIVLDEKAKKVLEEVQQCLHLAKCYVDNDDKMIYSINRFRLRYKQPFGVLPWKSSI